MRNPTPTERCLNHWRSEVEILLEIVAENEEAGAATSAETLLRLSEARAKVAEWEKKVVAAKKRNAGSRERNALLSSLGLKRSRSGGWE